MARTRTLTVPDMLWLNLRATGERNEYDFALLEEATFLQYGHGTSRDVVGQAERFLRGFREKRPFAAGNDACAFLGAAAFLAINGRPLTLEPERAAAWLKTFWAEGGDLGAVAPEDGHDHHEETAEACAEVLGRYSEAVKELVAEEAKRPLFAGTPRA
jgi:prophage maintenance system killer protein